MLPASCPLGLLLGPVRHREQRSVPVRVVLTVGNDAVPSFPDTWPKLTEAIICTSLTLTMTSSPVHSPDKTLQGWHITRP